MTDSPPQSLIGVSVRTVNPGDSPWIESASYGRFAPFRWRSRGLTQSPDLLARKLWEDVIAQWVAQSDSAGVLGLLQIHDVDFRNGVGELSLLPVNSPAATSESSSEAWHQAVRFACAHGARELNLRILYLRVLAPVLPFVELAFRNEIVASEGALREFEREGASLVDLHHLRVDIEDADR